MTDKSDNEGRIPVRVLTGPTASGKTVMGLRLAEENGWEICCMDSMQVYRGLDIGTAKPTLEDQKRVPHHLLDLCEPTEAFSAAIYRDQAEALVKALFREGREVLFVGGTGLYLQIMKEQMLLGATGADEKRRAELRDIAAQPDGRWRLHALLKQLDPDTAARLPVNDLRRVIRAIEVTELTGIPFSRQPRLAASGPFEWKIAATVMPRELLYERINQRVSDMLKSGLKEEVKRLLNAGVPENAQSMNGLGYKEMIPCVRGLCSEEDAADAIRLGTRHYAKRQITFLKRMEDVHYVDATAPDAYDRLRRILG